MSTLAYFRARPDYGLRRAFVLAFAVHAVLIGIMFFGVRMQNRPGDTVTVELWEPPPPPPPPVPVVEAPKPPPPKVEPPQPKPEPKPEPEVKKPEIVEKAPPPKPKPKPKPEAKPNDDLEKLLMREQVAMEQRKLDEERKRADEERKRADDVRRKAESEKMAKQLAQSARNKALADYVNRIRLKVRQNWILPQDLQGNPEAVFNVVQLPTGEILSVKLKKSSGNPAYDEAVHRAILKASPLPLPEPRELFSRELELTFRPRD